MVVADLSHAISWVWRDPSAYNFVSGPLADIGIVAGPLGFAIGYYRHHKCGHCRRIARHTVMVDGTSYQACRHCLGRDHVARARR